LGQALAWFGAAVKRAKGELPQEARSLTP
jgi:hypothetical protein